MSGGNMNFNQTSPNPENPGVNDVDPEEVKINSSNLTLIDVREPDEFTGELGHVEGASLIPLGELESRFQEISNNKTVIFICRSGGRSGRATSFAQSKGLEDCFNMKGGMLLWNERNYETTTKV